MKELIVTALLALSVLGSFASALGILSARASFDRLHYVGAAAIVAPVPVAVAIVVENGITAQMSVETLLIVLVLLATNPVATHALARAFRVRTAGDLRAGAGDEIVS